MIGATMAVSTIMDVATTIAASGDSTNANKTTSNGYSSSKSSRGYLRLSPFPARSAIMMGL
ncbi:hypothetical protein FACS1894166_00660 [Bacilli bacterium]|nr:hypothetical protein FACS1894166_00660 [Bacilli bacterium]